MLFDPCGDGIFVRTPKVALSQEICWGPRKGKSLCGERRSQGTGGIFPLGEMEQCGLCFDGAASQICLHFLPVGKKIKVRLGQENQGMIATGNHDHYGFAAGRTTLAGGAHPRRIWFFKSVAVQGGRRWRRMLLSACGMRKNHRSIALARFFRPLRWLRPPFIRHRRRSC